MTMYHHTSAQTIADQILNSWRSREKWRNAFVSKGIQLTRPSKPFPQADKCFQDFKKKVNISLEFKPYTETKRGIMTGLGQCIGYLNKSHASILVSPNEITSETGEIFDMGNFLKKTFEKFIFGKLPIALFTYEGENLKNLKLVCNICDKLKNKVKIKFIGSETNYWAFWRDYPVDSFYKLSISAEDIKSEEKRSEKVWDEYFFKYFAPPNTLKTLDLIESNISYEDGAKMIPFQDTKIRLTKKLDMNEISKKDAINKLEEKWSKKQSDNLYRDYKKNHFIFMDHNNLWDENLFLTQLGKNFIDRIKRSNGKKEVLIDEIAQILLVEGSHHDLIEEIEEMSLELSFEEDKDYLKFLYNELDKKGHISKNPNRKTSGSRRFLTAERQLWGKLDLIKKNGSRYFFPGKGYIFNKERIMKLISEFYKNYGKYSNKNLGIEEAENIH